MMESILLILLQSVGVLYQKRYDRLHKSIYGLSYDMYALDIISRLMMIYISLQYMFSPLIRKQLANRFPLFYPLDGQKVVVNFFLLMAETGMIYFNLKVMKQLINYRKTKHIHQGFSVYLFWTLALCMVFHVFTLACSTVYLPESDMGKFGIFYVEHVNYIWVNVQFFQCVKFVPQISLNWMGNCTKGLSSKFVIMSLVSSVAGVLSLYVNSTDATNFFLVPWNSYPLFVFICQTMSVLLILYQAQYLYIKNSPYLPKRT